MTIFGLAESFKTMNRPDAIVTHFDVLFLGKYYREGREILTKVIIQVLRNLGLMID